MHFLKHACVRAQSREEGIGTLMFRKPMLTREGRAKRSHLRRGQDVRFIRFGSRDASETPLLSPQPGLNSENRPAQQLAREGNWHRGSVALFVWREKKM